MKKKILIIGGAGFIGHNLGLNLCKKDYEVYIVDSLAVNNFFSVINNKDNLKNPKLAEVFLQERLSLIRSSNIKMTILDARDYHQLSKIISAIVPDVIIQLAAVSHANRSNKDPHSTFDHSLRTLENALDCAKHFGSHFIYFSSSMVYGNFKQTEVNENSLCDPIGIYGALKYSGEKLVKAYNQVFNLPYTIIRPSALYGERCISRRVGQIFIENAITNNDIVIEGDGKDKLDFTYISDLVAGVEKVITNKNSINQIFNLTFGSGNEINKLIEILKSEFNKLNVIYKEKDKFMPVRGKLSIEKAKKLLNYYPEWNLEKGYLNYIKWYKETFKKNQNAFK